MNTFVRLFEGYLSRIRAQGSLLHGASLPSEEYEDWNAVNVCAKIIQEDANRALELLDEYIDETESKTQEKFDHKGGNNDQ